MSAYPNPSSASARLFERACATMPGGNSRIAVYQAPYPIFVARAKGSRVTDVDGTERIDFINNQSALVHGHCFEPVVEAVERQLRLGASFSGPTVAEIELGEHLKNRVASVERIRFTNSGSEAVMFAVKAARAFTGRHKIAKCEGAYHGSYDFVEISRGSGPDTWGPADAPARVPYTVGTPPLVAEHAVVVPYNDVERTRTLLMEEAGELAAIIVEPISNRTGMIPGEAEYFDFLRCFASQNGILLIYDEIISFRAGLGGAQERFPVPDLTTFGKVIGGGFPVGALGGREDVMAVFDQRAGSPLVPHTGTFNANPISMVAGLAALTAFDSSSVESLNRRGDGVRRAINGLFAELGYEGQASGAGSLFRIHFKGERLTDHRSAYPTRAQAAALTMLHREYTNRGFVLSANCSGNVSTVSTDSEVDQFLAATRAALSSVFAAAKKPLTA